MDTNQKSVYAIKAFTQNHHNPKSFKEFTQTGFLVFKTKEKANSFLNIVASYNKNRIHGRYEAHGYVYVNDFIYGNLQNSPSYFTAHVGDFVDEPELELEVDIYPSQEEVVEITE